jgi:serine/threonine-protein kinase RsbW
MEKTFARSLASLEGVFGAISEFATTCDIPESVAFDLRLAVEEIFVNMVKYNPGSPNHIKLSLTIDREHLIASLEDSGVKPFDVTKVADYDTSLPLEKRRPGGLGIHLARKMMDDVRYEREDRRNTITMIKLLGGSNV